MRRLLEPALRRLWSGEGGAAVRIAGQALRPLEALYRTGVALRNAAYDREWLAARPAPIPVVSVGNIAVGGTGKTPVAAWIARVLADAGRKPAVLVRGYGDDEVALHRRWNPGVPVVVEPDRLRGAGRAAGSGRDVAVLDDGFQHRRLARALDLVLLAVEGPWADDREGGGAMLPRGPLREPFTALERADRLVLTRRTAHPERARRALELLRRRFPETPVSRVRLAPRDWTDLDGAPTEPPRGPLLAVAGIARPESFLELAGRAASCEVDLLAFPDHHRYGARDLRRIRSRARGRTVVTTEKDAVRLGRLAGRGLDVRVLRLGVEVEGGGDGLRSALLGALGGPARVEGGTP